MPENTDAVCSSYQLSQVNKKITELQDTSGSLQDPDFPSQEFTDLLLAAVLSENTDKLDILLKDHNELLTTSFHRQETNSYATLLGFAARHGKLDVVRHLVETLKVDTNAYSHSGLTALHEIVLGDTSCSGSELHAQIARVLLDNGADKHKKSLHFPRTSPYDYAQMGAPCLRNSLLSRMDPLRDPYYASHVRTELERGDNMRTHAFNLLAKRNKPSLRSLAVAATVGVAAVSIEYMVSRPRC
jgi:hypothetical protein